jgi:hypothetical protein
MKKSKSMGGGEKLFKASAAATTLARAIKRNSAAGADVVRGDFPGLLQSFFTRPRPTPNT